MTIRIAINGYGRIGRCILRSVFENKHDQDITVVAINDLSGIQSTAHLTRYDSTHGRFQHAVQIDGEHLIIANQRILITNERDPKNLPWAKLNVDVVLECTGRFTKRAEAALHLASGAKKVLISAPGTDVDATVVYGVNHSILTSHDTIVSNASCTTNCLAPVVKPLHAAIGIESGLLNTIHAYTKDQLLLDGNHIDLHRARAAAHSIIPTKTGAASAVGLVLPELIGKLDGFAMRIPTMNVSAIDLSFIAQRQTSVQEVNDIMLAAQNEILHINTEPLVSCDFNHSSASAVFDITQTKVLGQLVKIIAWYDNEWGFSNRMLDTACYLMHIPYTGTFTK